VVLPQELESGWSKAGINEDDKANYHRGLTPLSSLGMVSEKTAQWPCNTTTFI
jgi:hypothetical protein